MKKKFPHYRQLYSKDCGPNCLKAIGKYYDKDISLDFLRELCETNRIGTSLENLSRAAKNIGFRTLGVKISLEELEQAPLPCILHWENEHFLILYNIKNGIYYISDPALGLIQLNEQEFLSKWINPDAKSNTKQGIALLLEVTPTFYKNEVDHKEAKLPLTYFLNYLKQHKSFVGQLLIGLLVSSLIQFLFPFLTQSIVDIGISNQDLSFIYLILFAQIFLYIGKLSVSVLKDWILLHIGTRIKVTMISDFFIKLMDLPISFFNSKQVGDILQRITDHERIRILLTKSSLNVLFAVFNLFVFSIVIAIYSLKIFLIFLIGTAVYFLYFYYFLNRRAILDIERFKKMSDDNTKIVELLSGMEEIKLNNAEDRKRWGWEQIQVDLYKLDLKWLKLSQYQNQGSDFINEIKNIIITIVSATLVINGSITLGMMLAISYIIGQLNVPVRMILDFVRELQDARLSIDRLAEITLKKSEHDTHNIDISTVKDFKEITVKDLSFKYPGINKTILDNISFTAKENKVTAIVGKSGSGKTTLLKLLLKFYNCDNGIINYGKTDINNISHISLRDKCGVVMQEGFIFDDTFLNNVCLSDMAYDKQRFELAIEVANLKEFSSMLPKGIFTEIGKRGIDISTGEKQRILIARAIYKNPEFLFFDEATSSLDTENEKEIVQNLNQFYKDKTTIIIAHRLSTVKNADNIIVLDKGKLIENGTHDTLISKKGFYYNLVKNQLELGK